MDPVTLYKTNKHGKQQVWTVHVSDTPNNPGAARITITYGQNDGKMQTTVRDLLEGKNKNKKSATTPMQQACLEAESLVRQKRDQGYRSPHEISDVPVLPMLAEDYQHRSHDIHFPCFAQPKLDGVRCLARRQSDGTVSLISRTGKPFCFMDHIRNALPNVPGTVYLDGELYTQDGSFQDITSICKQTKTPHSQESTIVYHVFDFFDTALPLLTFAERLCVLEKMQFNQQVCLVPTEPLDTPDQVPAMLQTYLQNKYEGIVLRNAAGVYSSNRRSACLQKLKEFQDAEFPIVSFEEGQGRAKGTVVYVCEYTTAQGAKDQFRVVPRGTHQERRQWYEQGQEHIGLRLTVRFQKYSDNGAPVFPVGMGVRDYE